MSDVAVVVDGKEGRGGQRWLHPETPVRLDGKLVAVADVPVGSTFEYMYGREWTHARRLDERRWRIVLIVDGTKAAADEMVDDLRTWSRRSGQELAPLVEDAGPLPGP